MSEEKTKESLAAKLTSFYDDNILKAANNVYKGGIVNIVSDYPWALNAFGLSSEPSKQKYPHAFIREFRQNMSTTAASFNYLIKNGLSAIGLDKYFSNNEETTKPIKDATTGEEITNESAERKFLGNDLFSTVVKDIAKLAEDKAGTGPLESLKGEMNDILSPYKYMYSVTNENCLKYIFPIFKTDFGISNSYADSPQFSNPIVYSAMQHIGGAGNLASLVGSAGSVVELMQKDFGWNDQGIYIEKPKYFQVDTQGDSVTINFPLYNTVKNGSEIDLWKKNYEFIKFFALKNLPFKISAFRFKTPVLYEVNVPGDKYMPFSYVSKFTATSAGITKYLSYDSSTDILVPEAWLVSITFTSLLYKSANLSYVAFNSKVKTGVSLAESYFNTAEPGQSPFL